jgi:hypothetical protein
MPRIRSFVFAALVLVVAPLTKPSLINTNLIPIIMLKNIIIILSVILNLVFIPAFIVDYTAQEEEENLFNTHSWNDDEESIPQEGSSVIIEEISSDTIWLTEASYTIT